MGNFQQVHEQLQQILFEFRYLISIQLFRSVNNALEFVETKTKTKFAWNATDEQDQNNKNSVKHEFKSEIYQIQK